VLIRRRINSTREKTQRLIGTPSGGHDGGSPDRRVTNGPHNEAASVTSEDARHVATDESAEENGEGLDDDKQVVLEGEQDTTPPSDSPPTTRSGRKTGLVNRMKESIQQEGKQWVSWLANALQPPELSPGDEIYEVFAATEYDIQDRASDPISFQATSDPDTIYWYQAMQQSDKSEFINWQPLLR
jgi:hypothetical protein